MKSKLSYYYLSYFFQKIDEIDSLRDRYLENRNKLHQTSEIFNI